MRGLYIANVRVIKDMCNGVKIGVRTVKTVSKNFLVKMWLHHEFAFYSTFICLDDRRFDMIHVRGSLIGIGMT